MSGDHPTSDYAYVDREPTEPQTSSPAPQTLRWVERQVHDEVVNVEPLPGGMSSSIHRLTFAGGQDPLVVRRYTLTGWIEREPNIPHDETRILELLADRQRLDIGVPTPVLLASDPDGSECDVPTVIMSQVAGRPDIDPVDPYRWAARLARCLASIHRTPIPSGLPAFRRWDQPGSPIPGWTAEPELWREAKARISGPLPNQAPAFIHRDFHPCNVHWVNGEICAVVDWLSACIGPIAVDLAHCRWNLAMLADPTVAEHFTAEYRSITGYDEDVTAYDLSTILSGPVGAFPTFAWNALGRQDMTSETVGRSIDAWLGQVLAG